MNSSMRQTSQGRALWVSPVRGQCPQEPHLVAPRLVWHVNMYLFILLTAQKAAPWLTWASPGEGLSPPLNLIPLGPCGFLWLPCFNWIHVVHSFPFLIPTMSHSFLYKHLWLNRWRTNTTGLWTYAPWKVLGIISARRLKSTHHRLPCPFRRHWLNLQPDQKGAT